ncbi:MAG TPA: Mur ligase family protein [Acidimicrobiales bacterium]|nr:Mur ligase family protein [Acidimicrobiales bacterium]
MDLAGALAYLADHVDLERDPAPQAAARRLDRIRRLVELMGDPQAAYPVLHLTGTNGKGSTARMLTSLLVERGLSVGTYTSPHLQRVNERLAWNGEPISDDHLVDVIEGVAGLELLLAGRPTYFEILTAAAFRWFADIAVDVAVVEVGLGGRWDATNVASGDVAVVTNVSLDHAETIGPDLADIAREKAGIVEPGATLVLGETDPSLSGIFHAAGAGMVWERDVEFGCAANRLAHEGRLVDLWTPGARYHDLYLPVHGSFQGENAAIALAAAEAFFGAPLAEEVVTDAMAAVRLPGRLEVVARNPLCLLDGAHNPAGARASSAAVAETFAGVAGRILVVGLLQGREPTEMLGALGASGARLVVACPPPSPRALPPEEVAAAAEGLGVAADVADSVAEGVAVALGLAAPDELVLVSGSLYVVGAARAALTGESLSDR